MTHDIRPGLTRQSCSRASDRTTCSTSGHRGYHDTSRAGQGAEALPTVQEARQQPYERGNGSTHVPQPRANPRWPPALLDKRVM